MKKLIAILLVAAMAAGLSACGMDTVFGTKTDNGNAAARAAAEAYVLPEKTAEVVWLTDRPETEAALQALAAAYTNETGVPVTMKTAAADAYEAALREGLDAMEAPTLFTLSPAQTEAFADYLYNLNGCAAESALLTRELSYTVAENVTLALPLSYECVGIAADREALYELGYSAAGIHSFDALKKAADAVTASEQYAGAFAYGETEQLVKLYGSLLMSDSSVQVKLKQCYDLYLADALPEGSGTAAEQLAAGNCVFAVLSSADFDALPEKEESAPEEGTEEAAEGTEESDGPSLDTSEVVTGAEFRYGMLPILTGAASDGKNAVFCSTTLYFGVNKEADTADIQATLDFLNWLVTNGNAAQTLTDIYSVLPYFNIAVPQNRFLADTNAMLADGRCVLTLAGKSAEDWFTAVQNALNTYAAAKATVTETSAEESSEESGETEPVALPEPWEAVDAVLNERPEA